MNYLITLAVSAIACLWPVYVGVAFFQRKFVDGLLWMLLSSASAATIVWLPGSRPRLYLATYTVAWLYGAYRLECRSFLRDWKWKITFTR
jgi:hypothetical protein